MFKEIAKFLIILSTIGLILPIFSFAQVPLIKAPETIEEAKGVTERGFKKVLEDLPEILKKIWREEVLPVWRKMGDWFRNIWENYIKSSLHDFWYSSLKPKIQSFLERIKELLGKEVEERKPIIEEEFKKEKEELMEELPGVTKSLWERFKALLR